MTIYNTVDMHDGDVCVEESINKYWALPNGSN